MCGSSKPKPQPAPVYGTAPEPEEAPKLADPVNKDRSTSDLKQKRKGTKPLRTDLEIPGASTTGQKTGLQIPG